MSAEPSQTKIAHGWTGWENQVAQGRFVLRRCLGWSDQGAVFLTEHKARNLAEAAIKFVRGDAPQAQSLMMRWQAALNLAHPHLVQLFDVGRWQVEGQEYFFVVMEYGDQTLAEILRHRPLSAEETLELLPPVLDALLFLHRRQLVHSQLKPSNFLAVGDQLKLASDTVRPAGQDHGISSAGDVWSLGATLLEALTAKPRLSIDRTFDEGLLPDGMPASLVDTVRRCLSSSPAERPSIIELRAEYKLSAPAAVKPEPLQKVSEVAAPPAAAPGPSREVVVPYQPLQPPYGVTVSYHTAPGKSPAAAQAHPASNATTGVAQAKSTRPEAGASSPPSANATPAASSSAPVPGPPRDLAPPRAAMPTAQAVAPTPVVPSAAPPKPAQAAVPGVTAPRAVQATGPSLPASSAPRDIAPPEPAIAPKPVASTQPAQTARQQIVPPQGATAALQAATISQPLPRPPQAANTASQVAATTRPTRAAPRDIPPPPAATSPSQKAVTPQPTPVAPRTINPPPAANTATLRAALSQAMPATAKDISPPPSENIPPRVAAPAQPSRVIAPPRAGGAQVENAPKRHLLGIAVGALLLAGAVWIGVRSTNDSPALLQPAVRVPATEPVPATPAESESTISAPATPAPEQPAQPEPTTSSVLNEVLPTVPDKIQSQIQGHIYVTVRVLVDPAGDVIGVLMENPGPSKYFARISDQAARQWQFAPTDEDDARVWIVRFEYTSDGVSVRSFEQ